MIDETATLTFASITEGYTRYTLTADGTWWAHAVKDESPEWGREVGIDRVLLDVDPGDRRHVLEAQRVIESAIILHALTCVRNGNRHEWEKARACLDSVCANHSDLARVGMG